MKIPIILFIILLTISLISLTSANTFVVLGNHNDEIAQQRVEKTNQLINNKTDYVIFTGGSYKISYGFRIQTSETSEAKKMAKYYNDSNKIPYVIEESSKTTIENAISVKKLLKTINQEEATIISTNHWYAKPIFKLIFFRSGIKLNFDVN